MTKLLWLSALTIMLMLGIGCSETTETAPGDSVEDASAVQPEADPPAGEASADAFPADWVLPTIDKTDPRWKQSLSEPPLLSFGADKTYLWELQTNQGEMRFRLFHEAAPMHVTSTIYLTRLGFYDDVLFHRVIPGFMAQGGDPTGTGAGGPGYEYDGEFDAELSHDKPGLLSMANRGPGTDGSQFFITFVPTPFLDGKHTIFGELIEGEETLEALEARGSRSGRTSEPLKINEARISIE